MSVERTTAEAQLDAYQEAERIAASTRSMAVGFIMQDRGVSEAEATMMLLDMMAEILYGDAP